MDASGLEWCDAGGAVLLSELERRQRASGGTLAIEGLRRELIELLELVRPKDVLPATPTPRLGLFERLGRDAVAVAASLRKNTIFVGHVTVAVLHALRHPSTLRMPDVFRVAEAVGIGAVPIVALVGSLLGLILAFWTVRALPLLAPADFPRIANVDIDLRALAVAALLSAATALLSALAPIAGIAEEGRPRS